MTAKPRRDAISISENSDFGSRYLTFFRLVIFTVFTSLCFPVQIMLTFLHLPGARHFPHWYHRQCTRLLGFHLIVKGKRATSHPTLFVSNHVSYWDIILLGSVLRDTSYISKAEVAKWPILGWMAKLQRSVFIDRRLSQAEAHRNSVLSRLEAGDDLILFPEGTSDDGTFVLPFRSSLFAVAEQNPKGKPLVIQPVSIAYTRLDGQPMGRYLRNFFAWYGDMDLLPHLLHGLGLGHVSVEVSLHDPVTLMAFEDRKALATYCHHVVSQGVGESLAGHKMTGK